MEHKTFYIQLMMRQPIINTYDENNTVPILRYEITVKYNTGVEYTMKCPDKKMAIQFLNGYIE